MTDSHADTDNHAGYGAASGGFESRLRAAVAAPFEGWREIYESFSPVDLATGYRQPRTPPPDGSSRRAAVLVPVVPHAEGAHLVYTLRKGNLQDHAGQISFPGGGKEPEDATLLDTALRESREEIGLSASEVETLGELDEMYIPRSRYRVSPFVGLLPVRAELEMAPEEVEEIFTVPLEALMAEGTLQRVSSERGDRRYEIPVFAVDGVTTDDGGGELKRYKIWGATAAITAGLLCRLGWRPH